MTGPIDYETKPPNTVQAMFFGGEPEQKQAVADWVSSLAGEDAIVDDGLLSVNMLVIRNGDFEFSASGDQYVYLDEDGFHAISKNGFEMVYRKKPVVP